MLTIVVAILAGVLLTHLLESALRAAVLVIVVLGVIHLTHDVSFEALVNDGAHELYNESSYHAVHPTHSFRL